MTNYTSVSTEPVKRFFVQMLTRDIAVEDAILDLLDNCVDGILRSQSASLTEGDKPYDGFWAKITVSKDLFQIEDNCGGIPWSEHERTFRMGRLPLNESPTDESSRSIGVYGIGMKRAIFKMGSEALIWTQNSNDNYEVEISPAWMLAENKWDLEVKEGRKSMDHDGTFVIVQNLHPDVSEHFAAEIFRRNLLNTIQSQYAVIMRKGFHVEVNGTIAKPKPIELRFEQEKNSDGTEIRPYMFKTLINDVDVFLVVGLNQPIPDAEIISEEQKGVQYSSENAGWTVICNDRVVLYCNRDELTGWGTGGVPRYHTQFIAISGVVEFSGDPIKLPTTTTKRGLDYSSTIYQQVLDRMREGTRTFTSFTNRWKTREDVVKSRVSLASAISYSKVKEEAANLGFTSVRVRLKGEQYKPNLPLPPGNVTDVRISYSREKVDVLKLAEKLLPEIEELKERDIRRKVGEESFDYTYKQLVGEKANSNGQSAIELPEAER